MTALATLRAGCVAGVLALGAARAAPCAAQGADTRVHPGFNLFSVQQDVDIGRASALQADSQLQMLNDPAVDAWLNRIIQKLAAVAPGAQYPYHIRAVNSADINAFALPGGPMYVNRGLIAAAGSEAELAGVLAHEMSHVALRHGTHQASEAYLAQTGLGVLGGLLGKNGGSAGDIVNAVGGLGLNAAFLKFGRDAEYQADETGAEIMARAGYNPIAMADFFEKLRVIQGHDPSKLEQFFSDHPPTADRESRIRQMAGSFARGSDPGIGGFAAIQGTLAGLPAAPTQTAQGTTTTPSQPATAQSAFAPAPVHVAKASARRVRFQQPSGFFTIDYPDNWRAYPENAGLGVSLAPDGGVVNSPDGQQALSYGVIVNHYQPFQQGSTGTLRQATDDLVAELMRANTYLTTRSTTRARNTSTTKGFAVTLSGTSPVTGQEERVRVVTRGLPDGHVVYALGIAPGRSAATFDPLFTRMLASLRIDDQAAHRAQ